MGCNSLSIASDLRRPLIFRSNSLRPVRAFHSVSHPHAEVISADAFARGVIRSGTDYQVFERGLKGLFSSALLSLPA